MSDLTDWIQSNWFELASLTAQFAILALLVWYARTMLKNSAASQPFRRQVESSPQPSEVPTFSEASPTYAPAEAQPVGFGGVGRMLSPIPEPQVHQTEVARHRRVERLNPWPAVVKWLRAPMSNRGGVAWRRVTRQIS
jgi:hypothetical protein